MKQILLTCSFGTADQYRFAQVSEDVNPVYLGPLLARRTLFGEGVVHGAYLLLRALDRFLAQRPPAAAGPVTLRRLRERADDVDAAELPGVLSLEEIEGCVGTPPLEGDFVTIATEFPDLVRRVSARQIAELLTCSRLAGMECPGLHSIFSSFDLEFRAPELDHDYFDSSADRVVATYQRGEGDAIDLAQDIRSGAGDCEVVHCDVTHPGKAFEWIDAQGIVLTHLYYFASPRIFARRGPGYSQELYQRFAAPYVDGFAVALRACQQCRPEGISAFYPSRVIVEALASKPAEYCNAKRAGEKLGREFDELDSPICVRVARMPRMETEQTASLVHIPAASSLDTMLSELRALQEQARG